jgi:hypothetical protein
MPTNLNKSIDYTSNDISISSLFSNFDCDLFSQTFFDSEPVTTKKYQQVEDEDTYEQPAHGETYEQPEHEETLERNADHMMNAHKRRKLDNTKAQVFENIMSFYKVSAKDTNVDQIEASSLATPKSDHKKKPVNLFESTFNKLEKETCVVKRAKENFIWLCRKAYNTATKKSLETDLFIDTMKKEGYALPNIFHKTKDTHLEFDPHYKSFVITPALVQEGIEETENQHNRSSERCEETNRPLKLLSEILMSKNFIKV